LIKLNCGIALSETWNVDTSREILLIILDSNIQ